MTHGLNSISRPSAPAAGSSSVKRLRVSQGSARCLLSVFISDALCKRLVSGTRVLCRPCGERLAAAGVSTLVFDDGRQVVDVASNTATDVDVLERVVRNV